MDPVRPASSPDKSNPNPRFAGTLDSQAVYMGDMEDTTLRPMRSDRPRLDPSSLFAAYGAFGRPEAPPKAAPALAGAGSSRLLEDAMPEKVNLKPLAAKGGLALSPSKAVGGPPQQRSPKGSQASGRPASTPTMGTPRPQNTPLSVPPGPGNWSGRKSPIRVVVAGPPSLREADGPEERGEVQVRELLRGDVQVTHGSPRRVSVAPDGSVPYAHPLAPLPSNSGLAVAGPASSASHLHPRPPTLEEDQLSPVLPSGTPSPQVTGDSPTQWSTRAPEGQPVLQRDRAGRPIMLKAVSTTKTPQALRTSLSGPSLGGQLHPSTPLPPKPGATPTTTHVGPAYGAMPEEGRNSVKVTVLSRADVQVGRAPGPLDPLRLGPDGQPIGAPPERRRKSMPSLTFHGDAPPEKETLATGQMRHRHKDAPGEGNPGPDPPPAKKKKKPRPADPPPDGAPPAEDSPTAEPAAPAQCRRKSAPLLDTSGLLASPKGEGKPQKRSNSGVKKKKKSMGDSPPAVLAQASSQQFPDLSEFQGAEPVHVMEVKGSEFTPPFAPSGPRRPSLITSPDEDTAALGVPPRHPHNARRRSFGGRRAPPEVEAGPGEKAPKPALRSPTGGDGPEGSENTDTDSSLPSAEGQPPRGKGKSRPSYAVLGLLPLLGAVLRGAERGPGRLDQLERVLRAVDPLETVIATMPELLEVVCTACDGSSPLEKELSVKEACGVTAAFLAGLLAAHRPRPDADSAYALADEELEECKRKLRRMKQKYDEELAAVEVAAGERAQRQGLELAAMAVRVQELLLEKDRLALQVAELHAQAQACVAATEASTAQRAQWEEDRRRADRLDEEVKRVSAELTEARSDQEAQQQAMELFIRQLEAVDAQLMAGEVRALQDELQSAKGRAQHMADELLTVAAMELAAQAEIAQRQQAELDALMKVLQGMEGRADLLAATMTEQRQKAQEDLSLAQTLRQAGGSKKKKRPKGDDEGILVADPGLEVVGRRVSIRRVQVDDSGQAIGEAPPERTASSESAGGGGGPHGLSITVDEPSRPSSRGRPATPHRAAYLERLARSQRPAEREAARVAKQIVEDCWEPADFLKRIHELVVAYETEKEELRRQLEYHTRMRTELRREFATKEGRLELRRQQDQERLGQMEQQLAVALERQQTLRDEAALDAEDAADFDALAHTASWSVAPLIEANSIVFEIVGDASQIPSLMGSVSVAAQPGAPAAPRKDPAHRVASRMAQAVRENCDGADDMVANVYQLVVSYERQIKVLVDELLSKQKEWAQLMAHELAMQQEEYEAYIAKLQVELNCPPAAATAAAAADAPPLPPTITTTLEPSEPKADTAGSPTLASVRLGSSLDFKALARSHWSIVPLIRRRGAMATSPTRCLGDAEAEPDPENIAMQLATAAQQHCDNNEALLANIYQMALAYEDQQKLLRRELQGAQGSRFNSRVGTASGKTPPGEMSLQPGFLEYFQMSCVQEQESDGEEDEEMGSEAEAAAYDSIAQKNGWHMASVAPPSEKLREVLHVSADGGEVASEPTAEDKRAALVVANAARMHCKTGKQLVAGIYHLALLREGDTRLAVAGVSQATGEMEAERQRWEAERAELLARIETLETTPAPAALALAAAATGRTASGFLRPDGDAAEAQPASPSTATGDDEDDLEQFARSLSLANRKLTLEAAQRSVSNFLQTAARKGKAAKKKAAKSEEQQHLAAVRAAREVEACASKQDILQMVYDLAFNYEAERDLLAGEMTARLVDLEQRLASEQEARKALEAEKLTLLQQLSAAWDRQEGEEIARKQSASQSKDAQQQGKGKAPVIARPAPADAASDGADSEKSDEDDDDGHAEEFDELMRTAQWNIAEVMRPETHQVDRFMKSLGAPLKEDEKSDAQREAARVARAARANCVSLEDAVANIYSMALLHAREKEVLRSELLAWKMQSHDEVQLERQKVAALYATSQRLSAELRAALQDRAKALVEDPTLPADPAKLHALIATERKIWQEAQTNFTNQIAHLQAQVASLQGSPLPVAKAPA